MNNHDILKDYIEKLLTSELLNDNTDWGIEFSSNNSLLRMAAHIAIDMIED